MNFTDESRNQWSMMFESETALTEFSKHVCKINGVYFLWCLCFQNILLHYYHEVLISTIFGFIFKNVFKYFKILERHTGNVSLAQKMCLLNILQ